MLSASSVTVDESGSDIGGEYMVRLNTQPTANVIVEVAIGNPDIALLSPATGTFTSSISLTFTPTAWGDQTVRVEGQDDRVDNPGGSRVVEITHTPSGGRYSTGDAKTLQVWVNDDTDEVGWTFAESSETADDNQVVILDEDGGTVTYTVVLTSEPTSDVTVTVESDFPGAATVSPAQLTFTPAESSWSTAQTVTVTGVNDNLDNPPVSIGGQDGRLARITNTPHGGGYDYIEPHTIEAEVRDNDGGDDAVPEVPDEMDEVGLTLTPSTTPTTSLVVDDENGGRATYTVRLNTEPTGVVTVFTESADASIATVSPLLLNFTRANWDRPQTVTVTGVNDDEDNVGDMRAVRITHNSSGADYDSVDYDPSSPESDNSVAWSVDVNVLDDDTAGLRLSSPAIRVDENGTKTYTVRLATKPTANVTVTLNDYVRGTTDPSPDVSVSPGTLLFTFTNPSADDYWNKPQRVTVRGVPDDVDNPNNRLGDIVHTTSSTNPDRYEGNDDTRTVLPVTIEDDTDTAGLLISESAITVTEDSADKPTDTYTVRLNSAPPAGETVQMTLELSGDTGAMTLSGTGVTGSSPTYTLPFDATTWDDPVVITVTAVDDQVDTSGDARVTIRHSVSGEGGYNDVAHVDVRVTVRDDDASELVVPSSISVNENGGTTSYTVQLRNRPPVGTTVTVTLTPDRGSGVFELDPSSLDLTNETWAKRVTITGVNDEVDNVGNARMVTITHTPVTSPVNADRPDKNRRMVLTVRDDQDRKGLVVDTNPATEAIDTGRITVTEKEGSARTATFSVALNSAPATGDVTVTAVSSDPTAVAVALDATTLADKSTTITATVTAQDDQVYNRGRGPVRISLTPSGGGYGRTEAREVLVTVTDDEAPTALVVSPNSVTMPEDSTTEYTVELNSEPMGTVTVNVASSNADAAKVRPGRPETVPAVLRERDTAALTFTPLTWNVRQTVTIVSVNDNVASNDRAVTIRNTASGGGFSGSANVSVSITDDDTHTAELVVEPTALTVAEGDGASAEAEYMVKLSRAPIRDVEVRVSIEDPTAARVVRPASQRLEFTTENWEEAQTVTVASVDDAVHNAGGNRVTTITNTPSGGGYGDADARSVELTVEDDEGLQFAGSPVTVGEAGDTDTYTVRLNTEPADTVTVGVASSNTQAATVSPAALTFTTADWDDPQTVTVTGVDDDVDNAGDSRSVTITHTLSGTGYGDGEAPTVSATVSDDNDPEATLAISSGPPVAEGNTGDTNALTFVVTKSGSTGKQVTVSYAVAAASTAGADDYVATTARGTLNFAPTETARTISVTITGDDGYEPDETIVIELSNPSNAQITTATATGTIADDDEALPPMLSISGRAVAEGAAGDTTPLTFTVTVTERDPISEVVMVDYARTGGTADPDVDYDADSAQGTLTFALGVTSQDFTVQVTGDNAYELDETVVISLGNARNAVISMASASGTISNDDAMPALEISGSSVAEGDAGQTTMLRFTVTKRGATSLPATVEYRDTRNGTATSGEDYTALPSGTLTFASNETRKTISVSVKGDADAEADETVQIALSNPTNATIAAGKGTATGTITDDDTLPKVAADWLARFGRTAAGATLDAIARRMNDGPAMAEPSFSLAGHQASFAPAPTVATVGTPIAPWDEGVAQVLTLEELANGTSFDLESSFVEGYLNVWGAGAYNQFAMTPQGDYEMDGSVLSAILGIDHEGANHVLGLALAYSGGDGEFSGLGTGVGSGSLGTNLYSIHPYVRLTFADSFHIGASFGLGTGDLTISDKDDKALVETGVGMPALAAIDARFEMSLAEAWWLAMQTDAHLVQMVADEADGLPAAVETSTHHIRLGLESAYAFLVADGVTLAPLLEAGLRYDGGDAETGFGLDAGGGLRLDASVAGLMIDARGHAALSNWSEDQDESLAVRDWSVGGVLRWAPGGYGMGPQVSLAPAWGGTASSAAARLNAEVGYGLAAFGSGVLTPYGIAEISGSGPVIYRAGARLQFGQDIQLSAEGTHEQPASGAAEQFLTVHIRLIQ